MTTMKRAPARYQNAQPYPVHLIALALGSTAGLLAVEAALHSHRMHITLRHVSLDALPSIGAWSVVTLASYAITLLPFAVRALWPRRDVLWRFVAGLVFITIGSALLTGASWLGAFRVSTCAQIASVFLASSVVFVEVRGGWRILAAIVSAMAVAVSNASGHHNALELFTGALFGAGAYRVSRSPKLGFLDAPAPWAALQHEVSNAWNLFVANSPSRWERMYARGEWEFLRSRHQRPPHYVISGIIRDRFPMRADVLDVGCGHAILYPLLTGAVSTYTGLDIAGAVIGECVRDFGRNADCSFQAVAFEDFDPTERFDVIVINELLYYFPLHSVEGIFRRAQSLLRNDDSLLIVSMGSNPKVSRIWHQLSQLAPPEQSIVTMNPVSGSRWTVRVYRGAIGSRESPSFQRSFSKRTPPPAEAVGPSVMPHKRATTAQHDRRGTLTWSEWLRSRPARKSMSLAPLCRGKGWWRERSWWTPRTESTPRWDNRIHTRSRSL